MEIETRTPCRKCLGHGKIQNPAWADYLKNGYFTEAIDFFRNHNYNSPDLEPHELTCSDCDGSGYIVKWISFHELFRMNNPEVLMKTSQGTYRNIH